MWNTGINNVYNDTNEYLGWVDMETKGSVWGEKKGGIVARDNSALHLVAPWCINSYEVQKKAVLFIPPGASLPAAGEDQSDADFDFTPGLCVFQNYSDDRIYWVPVSTMTEWRTIQWCGEGPSSRVNIWIGTVPDGASAAGGTRYTVVARAVG